MDKEEAMKILKDFHDKSALFSVRTALETLHPELKESEDEKIRKRIIALVNAHGQGMYKDDMLAWLENIPYNIDHEKREGFHLGYKAALEKQCEQKPAWSEEDETRLQACLDTLQANSLMGKVDTVMTNWLKSLKQRIGGEQ